MSVVGFDIGNFKSSVGVARAGGIDIVANEYSDRITPGYVAFTNKERFNGHAAKQQEVTNHQNTISSFKRLIGRKMNDPQVQIEKSYQPLRISQSTNGEEKLLYNIDYLDETRELTCDQVMAMHMTYLKSIAEMNLHNKVVDCVLSVPSFMTDTERRAMIDSAQIAGLNCLKLMNDTTAVALAYGLYQQVLPEPTEKPHNVVFVDIGYSSVQCSAVAFNKGKLRMLATTFDNNLGGRDFDKVLLDYFQKDFLARYKLDAYSNVRARLRLRNECEKLKKLMSSNSSPIPMNIECFMNDVDVQGRMNRDDFQKMSEPLLARVKKCLSNLLVESKLKLEDIDFIEIVGGATRTPVIKEIIKEVFGKEPSNHLNQDEAVSRGATIMCAILSPTFKVKEFKIEECQLFPITLSWKGGFDDDNELEVFPLYEKIPLSKLLTIYKREPFEIEARYRYHNNIPFNDARIGKFLINGVTANEKGENSEVKLKARITKNGIFEISSPQVIETYEVDAKDTPAATPEKGADDKDSDKKEKKDEKESSPEDNIEEKEEKMGKKEAEKEAASPDEKAKKKKTRSVDLPLVAKVPQMSKNDINYFVEQELSMIMQDKKEKERSEAKNLVEEYVYEVRDKLNNEYEKFITEENKTAFSKSLNDTESWLYSEEAEDQTKSVYVDRLNSLKSTGEPLKKRFKESEERPQAFEELGKSLQLIKKAVLQFSENDEKYNHLEQTEINKVIKAVEEKEKWFEDKSNLVNKMKLYEDPIVFVCQIKFEKESLEKTSWSILNRPKPKVEPPKVEEPKPEDAAPVPEQKEGEKKDAPSPQAPGAEKKPTDHGMDVD
jgi:heat shock protein 4